ncbi:hypothetical protein PRZ48_011007 [Zasmidium cellare]|uniref:AA1-like domain-containing protein n=1 Tax=Zasmidium cellare TaxID=395010 RepID=A0ABR0EA85_ZASCE|nr:hypothetical protein PRZ48_011007 [Zasmidium cellare]
MPKISITTYAMTALLALASAAPQPNEKRDNSHYVHLPISFATAFYKDDRCATTPHEKRTVQAFQCVNLGSQKFAALGVTPNATFTYDDGTFYNANTVIYEGQHCTGKKSVLAIDATVPYQGCEAFDEGAVTFRSFEITTTTAGDGMPSS